MHPTFIPSIPLLPNRYAPPFSLTKSVPTCKPKMQMTNAALWHKLQQATLTRATFTPDGGHVTAQYTQRDPVTGAKRSFTRVFLAAEDVYHAAPALPTPAGHNLGAHGRVVFAEKDGGISLEWWDDDCLRSVRKLPHGAVYSDEWFSGVRLSGDGRYLAYVAERKDGNEGGGSGGGDAGGAEEGDWRADLVRRFNETAGDPLGEGYAKRRGPALFVHDMQEGTTREVSTSEEGTYLHPGQPEWHGNDLVVTLRPGDVGTLQTRFTDHAGVHDLGVRYCYNRRSEVGLVSTEGGVRRVLSAGEVCCFAPRVRGDVLIYLATMPRVDGLVMPHNEAKVLRMVRLGGGDKAPITLVGVPVDPVEGEFPGLYAHDLVESPWVADDMIVVASVWGSVSRLLGVILPLKEDETAHVADLVAETGTVFDNAGVAWVKNASISVLDACEGHVLIGASDPATPMQLFILKIAEYGITQVTPVTRKSEMIEGLHKHLRERRTQDLMAIRSSTRESFTEIARVYKAGVDVPSEKFQVTVLRPAKEDKNHLIVYPHGGPHTSTLNGYATSAMALLQKGYTVMYVNYRGSLGLGEKSLQSLPGNIGTQDVNEVVQATRWALQVYSLSAASFVGGSHSGFLGAHTSLIPGLFRGTVLRNPVVDIASMQGGTDIPDWCFCEAGIPATPGYIADAEALKKMYSVSPVAFVNECTEIGQTLLQLGKADRRVPVGQGLLWRRVLNGRFGDVCSVRYYPISGHAIDDVPEGDDAWVAALDFLDATAASPPTECRHSAHRKA